MFYRIGILKRLAIFPGKHLCGSLFFKKVEGLKAWNSIQKRLQQRFFTCEYCKIFKNSFFYRTPQVLAFDKSWWRFWFRSTCWLHVLWNYKAFEWITKKWHEIDKVIDIQVKKVLKVLSCIYSMTFDVIFVSFTYVCYLEVIV